MSDKDVLLRLLQDYGVWLAPVGAEDLSFTVYDYKGEPVEPPVRLVLTSEEAISSYADQLADQGSQAVSTRSEVLELVMMQLVEGIETSDLSGGPAFRALGIAMAPGRPASWFQERATSTTPEAPGGAEWSGLRHGSPH